MNEYIIKISGSGTPDELLKSLKLVVTELEVMIKEGKTEDVELEDAILFTQINKVE